MVSIQDKLTKSREKCCGCGACVDICPKHAIELLEDSEGFLYPNIKEELCISCGKCISVCDFKKFDEKKYVKVEADRTVYAGRLKDDDECLKSSSGGVYTAVSSYILEKGGVVVASVYNYDKSVVEFQIITNEEERDWSRGSKYLQGNTVNIYSKCAEYIVQNPDKPLLFVGLGCQAAAFKSYINSKNINVENVYIMDIVCHGVASPKIWREYIKVLIDKYKGEVTRVEFKDKRNGWVRPTPYVLINDREVLIKDYVKIFFNQCALRPSCHECPYSTVYRNTDLTIGDYWGIDKVMPDFFSNKGNSLILIHSGKGEELFERIKEKLDYRGSNLSDCLQPNLVRPTPISEKRAKFWKDYNKRGIQYIIKRYGRTTWREILFRKIRTGIGMAQTIMKIPKR